jgi:DNA-binding MarR family transcriptional regulator
VVPGGLPDEGQATLARRRAVRAERLAEILARLSPEEQAALGAALPAIDALSNAQQADWLAASSHGRDGQLAAPR